jgi:hypothetical protein
MSARRTTLVLGTAAGALLAAGLIPLATSPIAQADDGDGITIANPPAPDSDFLSGPLQNFGLFTDQGFADPDEHFDAMVIHGMGFTDVLTSGIDPSDHLATLLPAGVTLPVDVTGGTVDVTVNTFTDTINPALDSSFTIPFTDPLTDLWVALLPFGF